MWKYYLKSNGLLYRHNGECVEVMQQGDWFESDYSIQALEQLSIFKPIDESLIDDYMS